MQITVKGKGFDLGEALRSHTETSLHETLVKYFDRSQECELAITHEHNMFSVSAHLHVPGQVIAAECENADPYTAVNSAVGKLTAQIKKHKDKLRDHHVAERAELKTAELKTGSEG